MHGPCRDLLTSVCPWPDWLKKAISGLRGDLAAAQSCQVRSAALFQAQVPDERALRDLTIDLWSVTVLLVTCGQEIAMPTLLPPVARQLAMLERPRPQGVPPARANPVPPVEAGSARPPAAAAPPEPSPALPEIELRGDAVPTRRQGMTPAVPQAEAARQVPEIGPQGSASPPAAAARMPVIGELATDPLQARAMPLIERTPQGVTARSTAWSSTCPQTTAYRITRRGLTRNQIAGQYRSEHGAEQGAEDSHDV